MPRHASHKTPKQFLGELLPLQFLIRQYFDILDLYVLDGNLTGQKYRDNVLAPRVVSHFDNHALADRPMFMDDNARPHRARIVQHFFTARGCSEQKTTFIRPVDPSPCANSVPQMII
jgi:hypothetical protein